VNKNQITQITFIEMELKDIIEMKWYEAEPSVGAGKIRNEIRMTLGYVCDARFKRVQESLFHAMLPKFGPSATF